MLHPLNLRNSYGEYTYFIELKYMASTNTIMVHKVGKAMRNYGIIQNNIKGDLNHTLDKKNS